MCESPVKVLLIENHPGDAAMLQSLVPGGSIPAFEFVLANGISEAPIRLKEDRFDLVLLDLPDRDGPRVISLLEPLAESTPIVVLASSDSDAAVVEREDSGDHDCLIKGHFDATALVRTLRHAVETRRLKDELRSLSLTDELTGLHSRIGFVTLARQQFRIADRTGCGATLIYADIENMRWINENMGRTEGNRALIDVAEILRETFRESDIVARIGSDEFAVLAIETGRVPVDVFERRITRNLATFAFTADRPYELGLSTGAAYYDPERSCTVEELILAADRAMCEQRRARRQEIAAA